MNEAKILEKRTETAVTYDRMLTAVFSFALEREQINPFIKPTNKHGNNGGCGMSGRMPTRWKAIKYIDNATKEQALKQFSCYKEAGFRIVNYDTGECIFDGGSRF